MSSADAVGPLDTGAGRADERAVAREPLDAAEHLESLARRRPLRRAMLVAESLGRGPLAAELLDAVDTVGELQAWAVDAPETEPAGSPPRPGRPGSAGSAGPAGSADERGWPVRSPRALLRPIEPVDFAAIHRAFNDPETAWRLPSRGRTVLPSAIERVLDGADLQLVGAARSRPEVAVSLMALNRYDVTNATADLTVVGLGRTEHERRGFRPPRGIRFETVAMFVSHAFASLDLFKITAAVPDYNWSYFADGAGEFFVEEGRQRDQVSLGGRRFDVHHIAVFRDRWAVNEAFLADAFGGVLVAE